VKSIGKEERPTSVVEEPKQVGEAHQIRQKWKWVEPSVWTERMLTTLERGERRGRLKSNFCKFIPHLGVYNRGSSPQIGVKTQLLWVYSTTDDTFWTAPSFANLGLFTITVAHELACQSRRVTH